MDARRAEEWTASRTTTSEEAAQSVHRLVVDHSERQSALVDAVRRSGWFDVQMDRLAAGDYLVNGEAVVERKTIRDFTASLLDGRLFPQVARLAHSPYLSLLLIEGPTPASLPDHHSVEGALVSIAAIWRVPVLHSSDPEQSARMLRFLADQVRVLRERVRRRFDRTPKRLASRRLFLLQGLPGVGPALAYRLLATSVQSNASARRMPPRWPKCTALARGRPRVSESSLAIRFRPVLSTSGLADME